MEESQRNIINTWDQLVAAVRTKLLPKKHGLSISHGEHGKAQVWSPYFLTDPSKDNAWYNYGRKTFYGDGNSRALAYKDAVEKAKAWVQETYGYEGEWKGNSMRDLVPVVAHKNFPLRKLPK